MNRYRFGIGIEIIFSPNAIFLYDSTSGKKYKGVLCNDRRFLLLLHQLSLRWIKKDDVLVLFQKILECTKKMCVKEFDKLYELGFIVQNNNFNVEIFQGKDKWCSFGWKEAFYFHWNTYNLLYLDWSNPESFKKDKDLMKFFLSESKMPDNYKNYNNKKEIKLPDYFNNNISCREVLKRKVNTSYNCQSMKLEDFSKFLKLTYGQTSIRKLPVTGEYVCKTSPSGGSRHPTECYVIVKDVEGLIPGLYHYSVKNHSVVLLKGRVEQSFVQDNIYLLSNRFSFSPSVILILSTIFERSMFRYRESRSYRVMNFDIGHIFQTTSLVASSMGRRSYRSYTINDDVVDGYLGLDTLDESSMAFMAVE